MLKTVTPLCDQTVSLQNEHQKAFIEQEQIRAKQDMTEAFKWYDLERKSGDRTAPCPIAFCWQEIKDEEYQPYYDPAYYFLIISEQSDLGNAQVYMTKECEHKVYNLKVGTKYFWCVQRNGQRSNISWFYTELALPRSLRIDNVSNFRDVGGYSVNNGHIRQGLVYRGGELEMHMHLTPSGFDELCRLGIRTEIDMRGEVDGKIDNSTAEVLGAKRIFMPCLPYAFVFNFDQRDAAHTFFDILSCKENYPVYFHCWGGADRTGSYAFILGAFLGMTLQDLIYEYEVTSLSIWGPRSRNHPEFAEFLDKFMLLDGNTVKEKAETFLKVYASMTDEQMQNIYDILVCRDI